MLPFLRTATHCYRRWRPTPRAPASLWSCRCCREGRLWTWGAPHSGPSPWSAAEPPGGWFPSPCLGSHSTVCSGPGRWEWKHLTQHIFRSPHKEHLKHQLFSSRITSLKVFTGIVTGFIEMSSSQQTKPSAHTQSHSLPAPLLYPLFPFYQQNTFLSLSRPTHVCANNLNMFV